MYKFLNIRTNKKRCPNPLFKVLYKRLVYAITTYARRTPIYRQGIKKARKNGHRVVTRASYILTFSEAKIRRFFNLSRVFLKNFSSGSLQRGTGTGAGAGFSEDKKNPYGVLYGVIYGVRSGGYLGIILTFSGLSTCISPKTR